MPATSVSDHGEHEALLQFLYIAPVGLAQTSLDGEVVMMNPLAAQLLIPLSRGGSLANLFQALENVAPELRSMTANFHDPTGMVCEALRIQLNAAGMASSIPHMLSLTLLKLDENRLMAVLTNISATVRQERLLKQNEAWLDAILTGITDYAVVSLNREGCIDDWNASVGRVTGFGREALLGRSCSIFYPEGGTTADRVLDLLRDADKNGWSIDDGWRRKADGTRYWSNAMIYPLRPREDVSSHVGGAIVDDHAGMSAYCLIIRDITDKRAWTP